MLSKRLVSTPVISYEDMFMNFTQQFLQSFKELANSDFEEGTSFEFKIKERSTKQRINPIIRLATFNDIDEIYHYPPHLNTGQERTKTKNGSSKCRSRLGRQLEGRERNC